VPRRVRKSRIAKVSVRGGRGRTTGQLEGNSLDVETLRTVGLLPVADSSLNGREREVRGREVRDCSVLNPVTTLRREDILRSIRGGLVWEAWTASGRGQCAADRPSQCFREGMQVCGRIRRGWFNFLGRRADWR
jgi:hypothetical protein